MLAQLDRAASCELYGETCSRVSGFARQVGELVLWEQNFGPGVFTIFETKNRMLEE